jgi:hypothetical protein
MKLYAKRIEGQAGKYRLHTEECKVVRFKGTEVRVDSPDRLTMLGSYPLPLWVPNNIGKPCRSCKASVGSQESDA